jgi:hypothetical protein
VDAREQGKEREDRDDLSLNLMNAPSTGHQHGELVEVQKQVADDEARHDQQHNHRYEETVGLSRSRKEPRQMVWGSGVQ